MPRRYRTITWRGRTVRRRVLTKAENAARVAKMLATRTGRAQAAAKPKTQTNGTKRAKALRKFELTGNAPPAPGQRVNGDATPRKPNLEMALVHLKRAEDWLIAARYAGTLRELDPAHREMIQARGALLGLSAP